jgi:signal transduction histidine kinase
MTAWGFLAVIIVALTLLVLVDPTTLARRSVTIGAVTVLVLALHEVNRRGHPRLAGWILVLGCIAIVTQRAWITGGLDSPVAAFYVIFMMMAGTLLGIRAGVIAAAACALGGTILAFGEASGRLPAYDRPLTPGGSLLFLLLMLGLAVVLQHLLTATLRESLQQAKAELTQRRRAELRLGLSLGAGKIGVWELDRRHGIVRGDARLFDLYGMTYAPSGQASYGAWSRRVHPADLPFVEGQLRSLEAAGADGGATETQMEFRIIRDDGLERYMRGAAALLPPDDMGVSWIVGVNIDVTDRRRAEMERELLVQELRRHQEQLEALVRARTTELEVSVARLREVEQLRDDLVHMIIHDMRAPLTILLVHLGLMQQGASGEMAMSIDEAIAGVHGLQELADTLLDVTRLEQGKLPLQRSATDIAQIARDVRAEMARTSSDAVLEVSAPDSLMCECDAPLLRRVLRNLVNNAVRHSPPNGRVLIALTSAGGNVRVVVLDEGTGVPVADRERIFEKFGAASVRKDGSYHSIGLGLAFCKLVIEAHGGTIRVEDATPHGSAFIVEMPC